MLEWVISIMEQYGVWGLMLLTFLDSFISPIPPEVLLIPLSIVTPQNAIWYAIITVIVSVFGAVVGYWLGLRGGRPLLYKFFKPEKINKAENLIQAHGVMAVLIASFTPVPFKIITISSGVLELSFRKLILWSTVGRSARFLLEAILIILYGKAVKDFLQSSAFSFLTLGVGIAAILFYILYRYKKSI